MLVIFQNLRRLDEARGIPTTSDGARSVLLDDAVVLVDTEGSHRDPGDTNPVTKCESVSLVNHTETNIGKQVEEPLILISIGKQVEEPLILISDIGKQVEEPLILISDIGKQIEEPLILISDIGKL